MIKTKSTLVLTVLLGSALLTSCSKDEPAKEVTEEDAVELIEGSLQASTGGLDETVAKYSEDLVTEFVPNDNCGESYDTTYNFSYSGAISQADYTMTWGYVLNCNGFVPSTADLSAMASGTYSTNRMTSNDNTDASLTVSGLEPSNEELNFNGSLQREGNQTITINSNTREITSTITVTLTDVQVDKSSYEILSGTGTALVNASNGTDSFSFNGSIVFNGGGSATLTLNGNTYTINLN
ncbi:MAG: hypothetical protein NXI10_16765 [bacterium]|nr:hypothetical protein [bacterium]